MGAKSEYRWKATTESGSDVDDFGPSFVQKVSDYGCLTPVHEEVHEEVKGTNCATSAVMIRVTQLMNLTMEHGELLKWYRNQWLNLTTSSTNARPHDLVPWREKVCASSNLKYMERCIGGVAPAVSPSTLSHRSS